MGKQIQVNPEVADRLDAIRERMGKDVSYSKAISVAIGISVADSTFNRLLDEVELLAQAYIRNEQSVDAIKLNIAQARLKWNQEGLKR